MNKQAKPLFYSKAHNLLIRELDKITNLTVSRSIFENQTSDQYDSILKEFINLDIKIFIVILDTNTTVKLFCEIFKLNMYGKNYQWIIVGSYNKELYNLKYYAQSTGCQVAELQASLNGTLQTRVVEYTHDSEQLKEDFTVSRKKSHFATQHEKKKKSAFETHYPYIVKSYLDVINQSNMHDSYMIENNFVSNNNAYFHGYAFDVLLAIFKILSTLIENKQFSCHNSTFERNIAWFTHMNNAFNKISFKGVTVNSNLLSLFKTLFSACLKTSYHF